MLKMDQIGAEVTNMQEMLSTKCNQEVHANEDFNYSFPIENLDSFQIFEKFLEEKIIYEKFVSILFKFVFL